MSSSVLEFGLATVHISGWIVTLKFVHLVKKNYGIKLCYHYVLYPETVKLETSNTKVKLAAWNVSLYIRFKLKLATFYT
jgi:hypothetical protein